MAETTGQCFCGAVTWASPGPVLWAGHCHCESCRRATSSPIRSSMRRSTPFIGELAQSTRAPCTSARFEKSACNSMSLSFTFILWSATTRPQVL